jgi:hypothetical protein
MADTPVTSPVMWSLASASRTASRTEQTAMMTDSDLGLYDPGHFYLPASVIADMSPRLGRCGHQHYHRFARKRDDKESREIWT